MGILDLIYPENLQCICCGDLMEPSRIHGICDSCSGRFLWDTSDPFLHSKEPNDFDRVMPCCRYGYYSRQMIYSYKNGGRTYIAKGMGLLMAERAEAELLSVPGLYFDIASWVPSDRERLRKRGFDHAKLLCGYAAKRMGLKAVPLLEKTKTTDAMKKKDSIGRRLLLKDSFTCVFTGDISGKSILLIDDVITTGSTASACAAALKAAGAKEVSVLCFAAAWSLSGM